MTDDKKRVEMIARIRALMARTVANGCTEAEAEQAAATVDRLLGLYEIDLSETLVADQEIIRLDIKLDHHPVRHAAVKIGAFCDCKVWAEGGFLSYLGLEIDTEIAEYLTLMFQRALDREMSQFVMFSPDVALQTETGQQQMVHSFGVGMAARLGERLSAMKSKRDFNQKTTGFDLVAAKQPLIEEAFASLGLSLLPGGGGGTSIKHQDAYNAGRKAADSVSINAGVTGSNSNAGRIK
jgi:hypothetical protein